jgi:hypothetical protein
MSYREGHRGNTPVPFSVFTKNEINGIIGAGEKCSVYYLKFT